MCGFNSHLRHINSANTKSKLIVILGQTATGKSDLAVQIALKFNGEVVSADSRQVYRGLNLGTGKITKKEMCGVPHHLLDVANPKKVFNVSDYKILADRAIADIVKRGKVPILVGGTGFYIDSVVNGLILPEVEPNISLRKKLTPKSAVALFGVLQKLDPERAQTIDKNNPARLIRAIEIATALGKVPKLDTNPISRYDTLFIGLEMPEEKLKERIYKRIIDRLKKGMLREAQKLHAGDLSWKRMEQLGLEYRHMALHLQNKVDKKQMIADLYADTWQYAKRQKTWFKRNKKTHWLNPLKKTDTAKAHSLVKKFLK